MKKKIYTISDYQEKNIYRNTITDPFDHQFVLEKPDELTSTDSSAWIVDSPLELVDLFKNIDIYLKYKPITKEIFDVRFNDYSKYIIGDNTETGKTVFENPLLLEEYPEYLAGWKTIVTNTGLVCFYDLSKDENNFVIYDMFDDDATSNLDFLKTIKPDISMLKMYDIFEQPLSVRRINFTNSEFTPERSYVYNGNWCGFFNCDGVNNNITLNDNFFFEFKGDKPDIENIQFNYKPLFVFKIYNTDGSKKISSDLKILIDGKEAEADSEGGFYFIDLSDYKIENRSLLPLQISISLQYCGNGYLEVI